MSGGPLLEIDSLTFRYRRASEPAIRDLSLRVDPGEVLLVAGPMAGSIGSCWPARWPCW